MKNSLTHLRPAGRAFMGLIGVGAILAGLAGTASASPGDVAIGTFGTAKLSGQTVLTQTSKGTIIVQASLTHLVPGRAYGVSAYVGKGCATLGEFTAGPFTADAAGSLSVSKSVPNPGHFSVGTTRSMSAQRVLTGMRKCDNQPDVT